MSPPGGEANSDPLTHGLSIAAASPWVSLQHNEHINNKDHIISGTENHLEFPAKAAAFLREHVATATHILKRYLFSNSFYLRSLDASAEVFKLFFFFSIQVLDWYFDIFIPNRVKKAQQALWF